MVSRCGCVGGCGRGTSMDLIVCVCMRACSPYNIELAGYCRVSRVNHLYCDVPN